MNKTVIRNFAVYARRKLIDEIKQKAYEIGIRSDEIKEPEIISSDTVRINNIQLKKHEKSKRKKLIEKIREKGYEQVVEEASYTWFNRLIAIRFMEVNGYLPTGVRVLSSSDAERWEPDIIKEALNVDLNVDKETVYSFQDAHDTEGLFKYLLIKQCNALHDVMPFIFEEITDYTELLLPDNLLKEGSVIREMVESIDEEDWREQVEIIGWLYQYYISEKKAEVFEGLKKNIKITKENIPAATQLFTPAWIVKYMVENSLGRLWLESHPDEELKAKWKYYSEEAEQDTEVNKKLGEIREKNNIESPEDIRFLDPCMGSGHILVYAYDVLYDIYKSEGYSERDIPKLILEKNLYGLEIDDRAAQLASFALMMKARSKDRRIFRDNIKLNLCAIVESNGFQKEALGLLENHKEDTEYLINVFYDAKEYGSMLKVEDVDFESIEKAVEELRYQEVHDIFELQQRDMVLNNMPGFIKQGKIMSQKYDVVCTNPPYMGSKQGMNQNIAKYLEEHFPNYKYDLYSVFIDVCLKMAKPDKMVAMITQHTWMFLSSYQKLRKDLLNRATLISMAHLGPRAFEEISGEVVQTTSFILSNNNIMDYKGSYSRLLDLTAKEKEEKYLKGSFRYNSIRQRSFLIAEGYPVIYWAGENLLEAFKGNKTLGHYCTLKNGPDSKGKNNTYFKFWHEVSYNYIRFDIDEDFDKFTWFPLNKGGNNKWYGNKTYVAYREFCKSQKDFFRDGITWSDLTSNFFCRYIEPGFAFNNHGKMCFVNHEENKKYILAFLNSVVAREYIHLFTVKTKYEIGYAAKIPFIIHEKFKDRINDLVNSNIDISKENWDAFETSWSFKRHPLIKSGESRLLQEAFDKWADFTENQFNSLKANEEELNKIFIKIYKLQDELSFEVPDDSITIRKADREKDIKSLISYAVGCMLGRYSLYEEGLVYAGGRFDMERYKSLHVSRDNIIPILDDDYFEGDILNRFVDFMRVAFGEDTLEENLDYIADTLGRKSTETSRQAIRRYFLKGFYKDHLQAYQKRSVYWLFDSGKNDGFKALIYMHRYDAGTAASVRMDYLHKLQRKYEGESLRLDAVINSNASEREKAAARKKQDMLKKQMQECIQYDQVIAHVANQKIEINPDDGVIVNYNKFQNVSIPRGEGGKPLTGDLFAVI